MSWDRETLVTTEAATEAVADRLQAARRALHGWWSGSGALPTTLAGAELCVLLAFVGLRGTDLVQLAVSTPTGLDRARLPGLDVALLLLYLGESAGIIWATVRVRRYLSTRWAVIDTAVALIVLLAQPLFTTSADRVGTWTAWGFAISVGAAFGAGVGFPRRWQTAAAALALAVAYLLVSLPGATQRGVAGTVWSNAVAYLGFALFPRALASFMRRLGREADAARAAANRSGREAERDRQRRLLHDHETVMRLLAEPDLDPALAALVRSQAISGANRVRTFLDTAHGDPDAANPDRTRGLVTLVRFAAQDFGDLPIELSLELARGVVLDAATGQAVYEAIITLLHNIRRHANATAVMVHADSGTTHWEVSVRDDGVGFDLASTPLGFGLRHQVMRHLREHRVAATIEAIPGSGTTVILRGPAEGP